MSEQVQIEETVILEMQSKVREFKNELKAKNIALNEVRTEYNTVENERAYAAKKLRETLDFLQKYNNDAVRHDSNWHEESGFTREQLLELEKAKHI